MPYRIVGGSGIATVCSVFVLAGLGAPPLTPTKAGRPGEAYVTDKHWYPRYTGDYARDTSHLTIIEHGAYTLLLDHYYSTKQPLPAIAEQLHRICRAFTEEEKAAIDRVLSMFFHLHADGYHNGRADNELAKRSAISKSRSKAAIIKHKKLSAHAQQVHSKCSANATTSTTTSTATSRTTKALTGYTPAFEEFWTCYPRHDCSKAEAFKAYQSATQGGTDHARIIEGVRAYVGHIDRNNVGLRYIAHASTWLNQRRWESDYSAGRPYHDHPRSPAAVKPKTKYERTIDAAHQAAIAGGYALEPEC